MCWAESKPVWPVGKQSCVCRSSVEVAHLDTGCSAKLEEMVSHGQGCGAHVEAGTLHCLQIMVF